MNALNELLRKLEQDSGTNGREYAAVTLVNRVAIEPARTFQVIHEVHNVARVIQVLILFDPFE